MIRHYKDKKLFAVFLVIRFILFYLMYMYEYVSRNICLSQILQVELEELPHHIIVLMTMHF